MLVCLFVLISVGGLLLVQRLVPIEVRRRQNDVAGFIYAVLGVAYAVLLALLVIAVWERWEGAKATVDDEASQLAEIYWIAHQLPQPEEEAQQVRDYSRPTAAQMVDMPGFIAWIGVVIADRLFTITAWEDEGSPPQVRHIGPHEEAVERFFGADFATSVLTSVWKPERINALWIRCEAYGSLEDYELSGGTCQCGQPLPEPPPYW